MSKLQRLRSQLYISDNEDNEDLILDLENLDTAKRHTRKRDRIDYNENKRYNYSNGKKVSTPSLQLQQQGEPREPRETGESAESTEPTEPAKPTEPTPSSPPIIVTTTSNHIDTDYLKQIVDFDLNKKLIVLGDSSQFNYDYNNSNDTSDMINTSSTSPPPFDFTDEIDKEIKLKYEILSNAVISEKQQDIKSTINEIDKEISLLSNRYNTFKSNINMLRKGGKYTHPKPFNFKPSFYTSLFLNEFNTTQSKINKESRKLDYILKLNTETKKINSRVIKKRYVQSFVENRTSMINYLKNQINKLDNQLQQRLGNKSPSDIINMIDYIDTMEIINEELNEPEDI